MKITELAKLVEELEDIKGIEYLDDKARQSVRDAQNALILQFMESNHLLPLQFAAEAEEENGQAFALAIQYGLQEVLAKHGKHY